MKIILYLLILLSTPALANSPLPDCTLESEQLLKRDGYTLCYDYQTKNAAWTFYEAGPEKSAAVASRQNDFRADVEIPEERRATLNDYEGSGYDRGHLVPARDMAYSVKTLSESFLLSNMTPQEPGFNRGVWSRVEARVREFSKDRTIYVYTGPAYMDFLGRIGRGVAVPTHFYKIVYSPEEEAAIAILIPNEKTNKNYRSFRCSVDRVEEYTGIDFLAFLEDDIEMEVER